MRYKCKCLDCGKEFATDKSPSNWAIVACPESGCRSQNVEIAFEDYDYHKDAELFVV